jgi:hypothetical protein
MKLQWSWVALVAVLVVGAVVVVILPQPPPAMKGAAVALFVSLAGAAPVWVQRLEEIPVIPSDKEQLH